MIDFDNPPKPAPIATPPTPGHRREYSEILADSMAAMEALVSRSLVTAIVFEAGYVRLAIADAAQLAFEIKQVGDFLDHLHQAPKPGRIS